MAVSVRFVNKNRKVKTSSIKSRINDEYAGKIWFKKTYWDIEVIERRELINSMNLTEEEKLIMNDIVLDVEELAIDYLNNDKLGIIPYLGTFKLNGGIKNIAKHSEELKAAKKAGATKEELKDMQLQLYIEGVKKDEQLTKEEKIYRQWKKVYKKEYNELYQTVGKTYAEMFIWTKTLLKPIEFNPAFQEAYERLNNL